MEHKHSVFDTDTHFVIDPVTKAISKGTNTKTTLAQGDHNSEVYTFDIPRIIDGHDMLLCNRVEVHYDNIDSSTKDKSKGFYKSQDMKVSETNPGMLCFTWLVKEPATKFVGKIEFSIKFECIEDGKLTYRWKTIKNKDLTVEASNDNSEVATEEPYPDIIAQWEESLFGIGDTEEQRIKDASAAEQAAIDAKGEAVKASIPAEYSALSALADQNHRNKAGAIVLDSQGESIVLNDASEYPLQNLKLFGKSTQDGTPTPDAPVDIVSVDNPIISVCGKNLAHPIGSVRKVNGYTITPNADGTVTISGAALASVDTVLDYALIAANNTYKTTVLKANVEYRLTCWKNGVVTETPGTKVILADGTIIWGWRNVESQDRSIAKLYTQFTPEIGDTDVCGTYAIQIEAGTQRTEYEPYKEQEINITHTLHGIPVASGGNYIDADGQQWICDEVDLKRGVYVQRVNCMVLNGGETITQDSGYFKVHLGDVGIRNLHNLCSHYVSFVGGWANMPGNTFQIIHDMLGVKDERFADLTAFKAYLTEQENVGKPVTLAYQLYTPIETPLSDAEINAFKALHSNKPNATILNDAGAFMTVEYLADTKTYIDNKIAELMAK